MVDIITQAELQAVLETYNAIAQRVLDFRRRLAAGGFVEPGELNAHDPQEQPMDMAPTEVISMYGLDIAPPGRRSEVYMMERPVVKQVHAEPETTAEPQFPEWLTQTPIDTEYALTMDEGGLDAQECQRIRLDRNEFLHLKVFLAKMRSISVPLEQPEGINVGGTENSLWDELEPEEIAAVSEASHA